MNYAGRERHSKPIVFFDGVCNLCNNSVKYLLRIDKKNILVFSQLQSKYSSESFKNIGYNIGDISSIVLLYQNRAYFKSDAIIKVFELMDYPWKTLQIIKYLPCKLRDFFYDLIAENRYNWFGKKNICMIPDKKYLHKFL